MTDLFGAVVRLMDLSPLHRRDTVADANRLVLPPIMAGQCVHVHEGGRLVGWGSWAMLTEDAEAGYVLGHRKIRPEDWNAGNRLWLVDVIAPFGHAREVTGRVRFALRSAGHRGRPIRFRRNKGGGHRYSSAIL